MGRRQPPRTDPGGPNRTSVVLLLLLGAGLLVAGASGLGGGSEVRTEYVITSVQVPQFEDLSDGGQRLFETALDREDGTVAVSGEDAPPDFPSSYEDERLYVKRDGRIFVIDAVNPDSVNLTATPANRSNETADGSGADVAYVIADRTDDVLYRY